MLRGDAAIPLRILRAVCGQEWSELAEGVRRGWLQFQGVDGGPATASQGLRFLHDWAARAGPAHWQVLVGAESAARFRRFLMLGGDVCARVQMELNDADVVQPKSAEHPHADDIIVLDEDGIPHARALQTQPVAASLEVVDLTSESNSSRVPGAARARPAKRPRSDDQCPLPTTPALPPPLSASVSASATVAALPSLPHRFARPSSFVAALPRPPPRHREPGSIRRSRTFSEGVSSEPWTYREMSSERSGGVARARSQRELLEAAARSLAQSEAERDVAERRARNAWLLNNGDGSPTASSQRAWPCLSDSELAASDNATVVLLITSTGTSAAGTDPPSLLAPLLLSAATLTDPSSIRRRFRALALRLHPDRLRPADALERRGAWELCRAAYERLSAQGMTDGVASGPVGGPP